MKTTPPISDRDQDFLYDLLDRALAQIEDSQAVDLDALLSGNEHLRERAAAMVRLASRVGIGATRIQPTIPGYTLIGELGQGGMGTVYLARQNRLGGRPVALKVLPIASILSQRARKRFIGEALAIGKLSHANVVAIHDVVDQGDTLAYAMEWIDGQSLAQMIRDRASDGRGADVGYVCRLGISIARALAAVHRAGLVHRDVKPSNILIRGDGTPLLSDFGLVRDADSTMTEAGQFAGTLAYAAPEQLRGDNAAVDARSDVYSLGVTLFHALAMRTPFGATSLHDMLKATHRGQHIALRRIDSRIPRDLETIIAKAMDPEPTRRYQSADELADDLERFAAYQPIRARQVGMARKLTQLVRRNRSAAIGLAIGSVLSLAVAVSAVVYFFLAPRWVAAHLTDARLALLDPAHGNQIFVVFFFGNTSPVVPATSPAAIQSAIAFYDMALRWAPFDSAIQREREIVQKAGDEMRKRDIFAFAAPVPLSPSSTDPRSRGLYAFLTGNTAKAIEAWSAIDIEHDPDPLVAAALGILYLASDEPGRAYLPLRDACLALPNVGFLTVYQADAAVQCGDLPRAAGLLDAARNMSRPDPLGGLERVDADLAAAQGRVAVAERLYRQLAGNPIAQFRLARLLESSGRLEEAVAEYRRVRAVVPNGPKPREAFVAAAERWWASVKPTRRMRRIREVLDDSSDGPSPVSGLLRDYAVAARPSKRSRPTPISPSLATFFAANRSPSLESLSLAELAERLEVEDMAQWSRIKSYPRILRALQLAAWRSPWPRAASRAIQRLAVLAAATTAFTASAGPTRGDVQDFDYNFEDLVLGDINGQDGWIVIVGTAWVQAGPGVNTSRTVTCLGGNSQDIRPLPEPFHYTAADTAVVWRSQGLVGVSCCNSDSITGILGPNSVRFGMDKLPNTDLAMYIRTASAVDLYGDTVAFAHWYEIQVTVDFSVTGGLATLAYRDLTLGEQNFTIDKTLRNINLGASPDPQGKYTFNTAQTRQDSANGVCFVDNIHFDAPTPPCPAHTGDMNADSTSDGRDIQRFAAALTSASTAFTDTCPGDFDNSGVVDPPDIPGFVAANLSP